MITQETAQHLGDKHARLCDSINVLQKELDYHAAQIESLQRLMEVTRGQVENIETQLETYNKQIQDGTTSTDKEG